MLDVFTNTSMPFYKFGDLVFLEKIDTSSWIKFISERFNATGKEIQPKDIQLITTLADNHPYYVQQLSQQAWLRTEKNCNDNIIFEAHTSIIEQISLLFTTITESLTTNQLNLLRAIIAQETALSSERVISTYRLTSSANVTRSRKSLIQKDILDEKAGKITFQDPMYYHWLKNEYFKNQIL